MKIIKAVVIENSGADKVGLETDLPEGTFPYKGNLTLWADIAQGNGVQYVIEHFGISPEIIRTS